MQEPLAPGEVVDFELVLRYPAAERRRIEAQGEALLAGRAAPGPPADRAADPADIDAVRSFARDAGLRVGAIDRASRRVSLSGPAAAIEKAFGVTLVRGGGASARDVAGTVALPPKLGPIVEAVLGLSAKPVASRE
jgi:pro-kumamolisin-like protein